MVLASGTRASLRICPELTIGTTPATLTTAVTNVGMTGSGTGFTAAITGTGLDTAGFAIGQKITTAGFTNSTNNGTWEIINIPNGFSITIGDPGSVTITEAAATSKSVKTYLETLRATGRNINLEKNILETSEVDADGIETDSRHGFNRVIGSPGYELSLAAYDTMLHLAMGGRWVVVEATGSPTLGADGTLSTLTRVGGSWIDDGFRVGDIVKTTGFSTGSNNSLWRIDQGPIGTVSIHVLNVFTGAAPVTEATGAGKTASLGLRLDVTTGVDPFLVERAFNDLVQYQLFNGCAIDSMQMGITPEAMVSGTFNILGMTAAAISGTPVTADVAAAAANRPMAAFDGKIYEGNLVIGVVTAVDYTLSRNRSLNPVVGSKFSPSVFEGTARINGTLSAYFENTTMFNKFVNETESSVHLFLPDPTSPTTSFISIYFPRVKYNGASMDPPQEGPIVQEMPFRALKASTLNAPGGTKVNTNLYIQRSNF